MSTVKKFGTFAGVYTPSVLTILGVIMYLRLGWVVGEAGLIGTIIIIMVAHVISVTTGLSISSIATDKKIKTGGIYYILSRSLGLPMGGSIGITLFVGTALSIALYIVGFTENFLGIDAISNFLGMANDINSVRIIGSIVLLLLFAIAFISTSLAIKSQFFVLGAIALSLISVFLGFIFISPDAMPEVSMAAAPDHVPIMTIFAIFFPAVTGFTAGVAMSGDLKDPKSSIPKGTMLSIATGLAVYILLAIGVAYFVDRNTLINDTNFLVKIAIYSPLVVAGIWGATLSSALGGILGAPRILQAIANDKIIPNFLGKGYGDSNEPRNALIFTFFIAEMGVLIGKLDAIAEVVSMFYIAAYGFINLAFSLERWASTDFRPSFSINKWIGIIGFIASFGVMLELNPGAMFAAFIIMWAIYFLLKRKELKSDFGDVWGSVWSSMVRTSITKLSEKSLEKRNWKPNILLFSGKLDDRPHLLELSKKLVGKYGFLSHFDLQIDETNSFTYTKRQQIIESDEQAKGIFYRRKTVKDIYEGMEQIASTYGFAGVEPNTVFLGWARNTNNPVRFIDMLLNLYRLDLNVVMMDYDHNVGFGDKKNIDIWWRGKGQNGNLSLQLVKFLRESDEWAKASLRLLIVNDKNEEYKQLYKQATKIIESLRIEGQVRIINNQIENRSFYDIVQEESVNSSLIFLGLPEIEDGAQEEFVKNTNELCEKIGTVILVKASSSFIDMSIGDTTSSKLDNYSVKDWMVLGDKDTIELSKYKSLANVNNHIFESINKYQNKNNSKYLKSISDNELNAIADFEKVINIYSKSVNLIFNSNVNELLSSKVSSINTRLLKDLKIKIELIKSNFVDKQQYIFSDFINAENSNIVKLYNSIPEKVKVSYLYEDLKYNSADSLDVKWYKFSHRLLYKLGCKRCNYTIKFKHLLAEKLLPVHQKLYKDFLIQFGLIGSQNISAIEEFINLCDHELQIIYQESLVVNNIDLAKVDASIQKLNTLVTTLNKEIAERNISLIEFRYKSLIELMNLLNVQSSQVAVNSVLDEEFNIKKAINKFSSSYTNIPEKRSRNQKMLLNHLILSVNLLLYSTQLRQISQVVVKRLHNYLYDDIVNVNNKLLSYLYEFQKNIKKNRDAEFNVDLSSNQLSLDKITTDNILRLLKRNHKSLLKTLPKDIVVFNEESVNLIGSEKQYDELETVDISIVRLMDYMVQDEFLNKVNSIISELPDDIYERNQKLYDRIRVLSLQIANKGIESSDLLQDIDKEISYLETEKSSREEYITLIIRRIEERKRVVEENLNIYPFLQKAMNLRYYIRRLEADKRVGQFKKLKIIVSKFYSDLAANLWYRQSKSILLAQSFMNEDKDAIRERNAQAKAIESLSVDVDVINNISIYYTQLFQENNYLPELWVERKNAEAEIARFLKNYGESKNRALLIRGVKGSGKSLMSHRLTSLIDNEEKIFTIIPPVEGSSDLKVFKRNLKDTLETDARDPLSGLSNDSIVIFENLELWWKKTYDGFDVIDYVLELILMHAQRIRIVVSINSYSFDYISKLRNLEPYFTHDILLTPFDAEKLQQMIWKRHTMGGLNLVLNKKDQNNLHSWDFARLFSKYYRLSKGVPEVALKYWLNNIESVDAKNIKMSMPKLPDLRVCEKISSDNMWILQLIVLHSSITAHKLASITSWNVSTAEIKLFELFQIGFIIKSTSEIYTVNPLLSPFIENLLKTKKYL